MRFRPRPRCPAKRQRRSRRSGSTRLRDGALAMSFEHIVIAGAGHAGGCAAHALRGAGFAGRITLIGSERRPPYERPPLSKELLAGAIPVEKTYLRPLDWYDSSNVALRLGIDVTAIDRSAQRLDLSDGT